MYPCLWLLPLLLGSPTDVRCEWRPPGAAIADPCPEFSWVCDGQVAYRLRVAASRVALDGPEAWDTGWVETAVPVAEYAGPALQPDHTYAYALSVRDTAGGAHDAGPFTFTYQPAELPRLYPTIRAFLNFGADLDALVRDYDVTFSAKANEVRPGMLAFCYSLMATMVIPSEKYDQLVGFCVNQGLTREGPLESMFLHYGEDTKVRLHVGREAADQPIEERAVPGWDPRNDRDGDGIVSDDEAAALVNPKATARKPSEARVPIYYWGPPRDDYVMYPGSPEYRRYLAEVYVPSRLEGYDGLYVDTMPSSPPGPAAGRVLAEYRDRGANAWMPDMVGLLAVVKRRHPDVPLVGNAWRGRPFVMDGMQRENWLNLRANATAVRSAVAAVRALDQRGKMQWVQYNNIAVDDRPTFAPRLPVELARDQLYGVAVYLLAHGERTYYGYGRHPYGRLWKHWPGCAKVDLGDPIEEPREVEIVSPVASDAPNLLRNGGFEEDPTADRPLPAWEPIKPFEVVDKGAKSGRRCLFMESDSRATNNITRCYVDLEPRTFYTLSGWIRTEDIEGQGAQLYAYEFEGAQVPGMITVHGTTPWTYYDLVFKTGDDGRGRVNVRIMRSTGRAWFDDVRLRRGRLGRQVVYQRRYERGLVVVRPNAISSFGDDTATVIELDRPYRSIDVEGRPGRQPSDRIILREAEAAILIGR